MKTRLIALIVLISLTGIVAAKNTGNVNRSQSRSTCSLKSADGSGSELQLRKTVRNKKTLNNRWEKKLTNRKQIETAISVAETKETK